MQNTESSIKPSAVVGTPAIALTTLQQHSQTIGLMEKVNHQNINKQLFACIKKVLEKVSEIKTIDEFHTRVYEELWKIPEFQNIKSDEFTYVSNLNTQEVVIGT